MTSVIPASLTMQASAMIESRIGIAVHSQFRGVLDEVLLSLSGGDVVAYIEELDQSRETSAKWQVLVDALTIGETYFLRDESHFHLLRNHIFPGIIARHREDKDYCINVWSVGCASGEEPYSLAITLHELLTDIQNWTVRLVGTDINSKALHTARRGVYRKWAFRHTDLDFQGRYFDPTPAGLQIKPIIRQMVTFQHANLFTPTARPSFDLILCRNVLLYFSEEHTRRAETLFHNALTPGGWLLLGHAETIRGNPDPWVANKHSGTPIYQKAKTSLNSVFHVQQSRASTLKRTTAELQALIFTTYQEAAKALQDEEYDAAESLIHELLSVDKEHAPGHVLMASIEANRGRMMEAHQRLDVALEVNPLLADGYYLRALLYMEEDEIADASKALHAALYCHRYHPLALFMLGNILGQNGQIARATRYWETARQAISHVPSDDPVSDISNTTAGQLDAMARQQLDGWKD